MTHRQAALVRLAIPATALCCCAALDPHHPIGWILCPFRAMTGLPCPMCGMTRGLASILRGRWMDAISFHLFSPFVFVALCGWMVLESGHLLRLWDARDTEQILLRPAPWLVSLLLLSLYGALRWWGIINEPVA